MNRMRRKISEREGERGSILVLTAVAMSAVLVLMLGLAIDISHFYLVKTELQNAADAAALAGASGLDYKSSGIDLAMSRAVRALNANKYDFGNKPFVNGSNLSSLEQYVKFAVNVDDAGMSKTAAQSVASTIRFVKVTTPADTSVSVSVFFASWVIGNSRNINATATAGPSVSSNQYCDLAPFSVIECDSTPAVGCTLAQPLPNGNPGTVYQVDGVTPCSSQTDFTPGCMYTIRSGSNGGNGGGGNGNGNGGNGGGGSTGPAPGNFRLLHLCDGNGNCTRQSVAGSADQCKVVCAVGSTSAECAVDVQTGLDTGQVREGINTRFGIYGGTSNNLLPEDQYPPDTNVREVDPTNSAKPVTHDQYESGLPIGSATNVAPSQGLAYASERRRELTVPIVRIGQYSGQSGTNFNVYPSAYGKFFLPKQIPQGAGANADITAEYIGEPTIGGRGGFVTGGGAGNANFKVLVLYR